MKIFDAVLSARRNMDAMHMARSFALSFAVSFTLLALGGFGFLMYEHGAFGGPKVLSVQDKQAILDSLTASSAAATSSIPAKMPKDPAGQMAYKLLVLKSLQAHSK